MQIGIGTLLTYFLYYLRAVSLKGCTYSRVQSKRVWINFLSLFSLHSPLVVWEKTEKKPLKFNENVSNTFFFQFTHTLYIISFFGFFNFFFFWHNIEMRIVVFEKRYLKGLYWISVVKYINPFSLISRLSENIIECYHVCLRISLRTKFRQKELHSKEALLQEDGALRLDLSRYILSSKCIFFIGVFSNSTFYHNKSVLFISYVK